MNREEQNVWMKRRQYADPRWADTEFQIRRVAIDVQNKLIKEGNSMVSIPVMVPGGGPLAFETTTLTIHAHDVLLGGGLEGLLLIEEMIRQARGVSIEQKFSERLDSVLNIVR